MQVLLLAVRHRWRGMGLGSYLIQVWGGISFSHFILLFPFLPITCPPQAMKDPAVVGHYDVLLTFADHKAERFFTTHGFSDDPIITARYRWCQRLPMAGQW